MSGQIKSLADAVRTAMNAERQAAAFYSKAAENTTDEKGRGMFVQLVSFENRHYEKLAELLTSLGEESPESPADGPAIETPASEGSPGEKQTDIDAVILAIEAEKKARSAYLELAQSASQPEVRELFEKLAEEEDTHRKILEEQFVALSNRGQWTWGT